jgi:hypothetical protein
MQETKEFQEFLKRREILMSHLNSRTLTLKTASELDAINKGLMAWQSFCAKRLSPNRFARKRR